MAKLEFQIKPFKALTLEELYDVLQLRQEVFAVEQNCVYQDIDGKDQKAFHILGYHENDLAAYTRIFDAGDYFETPSIGRVVVSQKYRNRKWGYDLMEKSIKAIGTVFGKKQITISAQLYLQKFYENLGFVKTSDMYLEDGIPHIQMKIE
jgi:ElaA protein